MVDIQVSINTRNLIETFLKEKPLFLIKVDGVSYICTDNILLAQLLISSGVEERNQMSGFYDITHTDMIETRRDRPVQVFLRNDIVKFFQDVGVSLEDLIKSLDLSKRIGLPVGYSRYIQREQISQPLAVGPISRTNSIAPEIRTQILSYF